MRLTPAAAAGEPGAVAAAAPTISTPQGAAAIKQQLRQELEGIDRGIFGAQVGWLRWMLHLPHPPTNSRSCVLSIVMPARARALPGHAGAHGSSPLLAST